MTTLHVLIICNPRPLISLLKVYRSVLDAHGVDVDHDVAIYAAVLQVLPVRLSGVILNSLFLVSHRFSCLCIVSHALTSFLDGAIR